MDLTITLAGKFRLQVLANGEVVSIRDNDGIAAQWMMLEVMPWSAEPSRTQLVGELTQLRVGTLNPEPFRV